ncbi:MAG: MAPEG family protein [Pseudomonadales bacterium]
MSIPLICISLLGFLVIGLGFAVSSFRAKEDVLFEYPVDPENSLYKAVRAHGNTIEYAPILALLIYILGQYEASGWILWCMVLATFCRYLHAAGIMFPQSVAKPNPMRFIGALGTYISGFGLCIALFLQAICA